MNELIRYLNYPIKPNQYGVSEYIRRINEKLCIITIENFQYNLTIYDMSNRFSPKFISAITLFNVDEFLLLIKSHFESEYKHAA